MSLARPCIRNLEPYSTARDEYKGGLGVFLDANESPFPGLWNRYPDPRQTELKQVISRIKGIGVENIFLGNGSDEAIDLLIRIFCEPGKDNIAAISPSYGMYSVAAAINDVEFRSIPLSEDDFSFTAEDVRRVCDPHTKLLFLCSPNNPSGNAYRRSDILGIAEEFCGLVVVDEAYVDFSSEPGLLPLVAANPGIVVLQTMSKARGLASLRLGMAFACEQTIRLMSMVKYPYNISGATQKAALEALKTDICPQVQATIRQRQRLSEALPAFSCVKKVWPSEANFLLVRVDDADALYAHLIADGIIVRNRSRVKGCKGCLRITVGLEEENDKLLSSLQDYEKGNIRG